MPEPDPPKGPFTRLRDEMRADEALWKLRDTNEQLRKQLAAAMTELNRRKDDPPDLDPKAMRTVDPTQWAAELGYGKWTLKIYGYALLIALIGAAIVGSNFYAAREIRHSVNAYMATTSLEHHQQAAEDLRTRCVLALTIEQRAGLLADRYPGAWGRACWWMQEGPG